MSDRKHNKRDEKISGELNDCYHIHCRRCSADSHRKNPNCDSKPFCIFNLGEKDLNDVILELERVKEFASSQIRDESVPLGLVNPHNTCYINVLLQSLFRLWPFRKAIMSVKAADKQSVLYMLQKVFAEMTLSRSLSYFPDELLRSMMINTDVQCDSHEFFDLLMVTLKSVLDSQNEKSVVSEIDKMFSGTRLLCRSCLNCRQVFDRSETFSFLDCSVVNRPRLEDALQALFMREKMTGSEQYFCSVCNQKCDAEVITKIKELPPVLMIRMQRLQYHKESGNQTKLTNDVKIPLTLDFSKFSIVDPSIDVSEYVLVSVVHHHGDHASFGHYTCHVQSDGVWYLVNDSHVEVIPCPYIDCTDRPWKPIKRVARDFSYNEASSKGGWRARKTKAAQTVESPVAENQGTEASQMEEEPKEVTVESKESTEKTDDVEESANPAPQSTPKSVSKPATKTAAKPAAKTAAKSTTKSTGKTATRQAAKTASKAAEKEAAPAEKPRRRRGRSVLHSDDESEEWDVNEKRRRLGGTSRSRRMMANSQAQQSGYMCFYVRKDIWEQMNEEEPKMKEELCNCLDELDLASIKANNQQLEASLDDKFSYFLNLYTKLCERVEQIDQVLSAPACEIENMVFISTQTFAHWMAAQDLIQPAYRYLSQHASFAYGNSGFNSAPTRVEMSYNGQEAGADELKSMLSVDALEGDVYSNQYGRYERVGTPDSDEDGDEMGSRAQPAESVLHSVYNTLIEMVEKHRMIYEYRDEKEDSYSKDQNICIHNLYEPIYFRSHFKGLPVESFKLVGSAINVAPLHWSSVYCAACEHRYTSLLQRAIEMSGPLSKLIEDYHRESAERTMLDSQSHAVESTIYGVGNTSSALLPRYTTQTDWSQAFYISVDFIHDAQTLLKRYRKLLQRPEKCTCGMVQNCLIDISPTDDLVCEHNLLRQVLRRIDYTLVSNKFWNEVHKYFPNAPEVPSTTRVCQKCKRGRSMAEMQVRANQDHDEVMMEEASPEPMPEDSRFDSYGFDIPQDPILDGNPFSLGMAHEDIQMALSSMPMENDGTKDGSPENGEVSKPQDDQQPRQDAILSSDPILFLDAEREVLQQSADAFSEASFSLYKTIANGENPFEKVYVDALSDEQRRLLVLREDALDPLMKRNRCASLEYFTNSVVINDGCYFVIKSEWIKGVRNWLQGTEQYENIRKICFGIPCQDEGFFIPGYMCHFIRGVCSLACEKFEKDMKVELINEFELRRLAHYFKVEDPLIGFFVGRLSNQPHRILYLPGVCERCQREENWKYDRLLKSVSEQTVVLLKSSTIPSMIREREAYLGKKGRPFRDEERAITTKLSPSCSVSEWKDVIAARLGLDRNAFMLRTRYSEIDDKDTIRSYGISPETPVYAIKL